MRPDNVKYVSSRELDYEVHSCLFGVCFPIQFVVDFVYAHHCGGHVFGFAGPDFIELCPQFRFVVLMRVK